MPAGHRPPKNWFNQKLKEVKEGNPSYSDEQARATVGSIWYGLSDYKQNQISKTEGSMLQKAVKILTADSFMRPDVYEGDFVMVDGPMGTEYIDKEYANTDEIKELQRKLEEGGEPRVTLKGTSLQDYFENKEIWEIDIVHGWGGYMTAPGYMDRTSLSVYDSEQEAIDDLQEMYGDEEEEEEDL